MSKLLKKIMDASKIDSALVSKSKYYDEKPAICTKIPAINIALSGSINGGLPTGIWQICGKSKHFKSLFALHGVKAYLDKYDDAICVFYDSEFGISKEYFEWVGISMDRIIHKPIRDIEELNFDISPLLDELELGDHVIFLVDSLGLLPSKKELADAISGNAAADMTRAKQIASLVRTITVSLNMYGLTAILINHVYKSMTFIPTDIVSGGEKAYLASDTIWIISRAQEKDGTELLGYKFTINIEKSRRVVEKSKFPITVYKKTGIDKYSSLLEIAVDAGFVQKPKNGWYTRPEIDTDGKNYREKDTHNEDFWNPILNDPKFDECIKNKYLLSNQSAKEDEEDV